jgi:hypothetical protein
VDSDQQYATECPVNGKRLVAPGMQPARHQRLTICLMVLTINNVRQFDWCRFSGVEISGSSAGEKTKLIALEIEAD